VPTAALTTPTPAYWIQVGAFLDPKNAERLVERLRADGYPATSSVFEQSRVLYRVLLVTPEGADAPPDALLEKARGLGFTVEPVSGGVAVTGLIPLRAAIEASHRLREQGVPVQLRQDAGSATYRAVRVGSYGTSREADEALASLQAKGVEGFVARDR
jgi:cell division septation protein DedD